LIRGADVINAGAYRQRDPSPARHWNSLSTASVSHLSSVRQERHDQGRAALRRRPSANARVAIATLGGPASAASTPRSRPLWMGRSPTRCRRARIAHSGSPTPRTAMILVRPRPDRRSYQPEDHAEDQAHRTSNRHTTTDWQRQRRPYPSRGDARRRVKEGRHWKIFDQVVANRKVSSATATASTRRRINHVHFRASCRIPAPIISLTPNGGGKATHPGGFFFPGGVSPPPQVSGEPPNPDLAVSPLV